MEEQNILEVRGITKRFPGLIANDHIDLTLKRGEILALLGENGAGKTTLMNILYGIYYPNEGEILLNGRRVSINSPSEAMSYGIGMIHQHFTLVESLTVLENIVLGMKEGGITIGRRGIKGRIEEIAEEYGFKINPDEKIWQLSVGEQQRVEIVKTLFRGANILIMDEPTAVLTPEEAQKLCVTLRQMSSKGKSIIFISHKLDEVLGVADRITVLRRGRVVGTVVSTQTNREELAQMMVGREVMFKARKKLCVSSSEKVLEVDNLETYNDKGLKAVKGISFHVSAGEIFSIAGISGNGQNELVESIVGLRRATSGRVLFRGRDITNSNPYYIASLGVGYIPSDRIGVGLIPNLSCVENAILRKYNREPILSGGCINYNVAQEYTSRLVREFDISVASIRSPVKLLSGGNMQKLLFAREISENPSLLIAVHPTRGLDVGATEFFRNKLIEVRNAGTAILLISEDLDEIFQLSDRIAVIYEGILMGIVDSESTSLRKVGLMMAGSRPEMAAC